MPGKLELIPFVIQPSEFQVTFRFATVSLEQGYEYPANLENCLQELIEENAPQFENREVVIDLGDLPAISSKQLGAMLAVRKACESEGKIKVLNVRPNVLALLKVTKLGDFFDWD